MNRLKKSVCASKKTNRIIADGEKQVKLTIKNPQSKDIYAVLVDGCLIKEGAKADRFFFDDDSGWIVEFKGSDFSHALKQVETTLDYLKQHYSWPERFSMNGYIILRKTAPEIKNGSKYRNLRKKFMENNGDLDSKNIEAEISF